MAKIIYPNGQNKAVNLDNVDIIQLDDDGNLIKFIRKQVSDGRVEWISIDTWEYETFSDAESSYRNILQQHGSIIF